MNNDKITNYTIYSPKLAGYLMLKGFVLVGMEKHKNHPNKNVFFFKDSVRLQEAINGYHVFRNTTEI